MIMNDDQTELLNRLRKTADDLIDAEFTAAEMKRRRDDLIVSCRRAGLPLRRIGEAAMVSHQTVANIADGDDA
jgi:hypothetical protein